MCVCVCVCVRVLTIISDVVTELKEYVDKDNNSSLPSIDLSDKDAPKLKVRKFSGDLFNDVESSQVAVKDFLTQK